MVSEESIEKKLENLADEIGSAENLVENVMGRIDAGENGKSRQKALERRKIMNRFTKVAAAAVIIIGVVLSVTFLERSTPSAYALEQTIEASHTVQFLHIRNFVVSQDEPMEFWLEFDPVGQLKNARFNKPAWMGAGDGSTVIIWKDNKAQIWVEKKNILATMKDKKFADEMVKTVEKLDPKLAVKRLLSEQELGAVSVEIEVPADKAEPIVVTATGVKEDDSPFQRMVLFIDQATRLINSVELYQLKDGEYQHAMTLEYFDYNLPIDPAMFTFDDIPDDAIRMDQTTQEIGLAQGNLNGKEIAVKVVREFYEALIAEDYAKAGRLFEGIPGEKIHEMFGDMKILRIVSIGEAVPHPSPGVGGFQVPCKIEIEKDGVKSIHEPYGPGVRQVHGQPNRWGIHGGVE